MPIRHRTDACLPKLLVARARAAARLVAVTVWLYACLSLAVLAADRVALVIGNGAYRNVAALPNPPQDARAIGAKLQDLGFRVVLALDADRTAMEADLAAFERAAGGAEVAVVFYAGHGLQVDGENYLIPVDARIGGRGDLAAEAMKASEIYRRIAATRPDAMVLILDACRDNPFTGSLATGKGLATGSVSAGAAQPPGAGTLIGFAAAPGAVAFDGGDGNSPYTTALLQWIDRPGLEVGTLFRRVRGTVVELTRGAQVPWVEEALLREVYLNKAEPVLLASADAGGVEAALMQTIRALDNPDEQTAALDFYDRLAGAEGAVPQPAATDEALVREGLIWLSIRASSDPALFERFVEVFPGGRFQALAEARIAALRAAVEPEPEPVAVSLDITQPQADADADRPLLETGLTQPDPTAGQTAPELQPLDQPDSVALPDQAPGADAAEAALALDGAGRAAVQRLLAAGGDYGGRADAAFGPGTRKGIGAFQRAAGLATTGYIDGPTLAALVARRAPEVLAATDDAGGRAALHGLAAIAARGPGADPLTLRIAAMKRNDQVRAIWDDVARRFEDSHPGFKVEISERRDADYKAALLPMLGSSTPPDVLHTWGGGHLDALREAGFIRDLTPEMSQGWAMEFRPGALRTYTRDGHIYGVPTHVGLVSLWVNRALLDKAGVAPGSLTTWDGVLDATRRLKAAGIVPFAAGGGDRWPFQFIWGALAQQIGGRAVMDDALAGRGQGFLAPAFVRAGDMLRALGDLDPFQPGYMEMTESDAGMVFAKGGAAMMVTGNWRLTTLRWNWPGGVDRMRAELVRLPVPAGPAAPDAEATYGGVDGYAVNAKAPDEAVELLRLLASADTLGRISKVADAVPAASGADLAAGDPTLGAVARDLLTSRYHQLYLDQALGPEAGEVVNDAATRLATRATTGAEAAADIDRAWDAALAGGAALPPPATLHPLQPPTP